VGTYVYGAVQSAGTLEPDKKFQRFSKRLLKDYEALWLFANVEGVEPTNNHAERCLLPAVLWRKRSFWKSRCCGLPLHGADVDGSAHVEAAKATGVRVPKKRAAQPPRRKARPFVADVLMETEWLPEMIMA